ncbi:MAG: DUF503 domain-containing protein [Lentisphaerae bacterium]|nr:MAG: DUF503 domain-containing protein [Lentisphaerota bacterium]
MYSVALLDLELAIDHAQSLKQKRSVTKRIKERLRNRYNVSVAEVDGQTVWNYANIAVVIVSNDRAYCHNTLTKISQTIEQIGECRLIDYHIEFLDSWDEEEEEEGW